MTVAGWCWADWEQAWPVYILQVDRVHDTRGEFSLPSQTVLSTQSQQCSDWTSSIEDILQRECLTRRRRQKVENITG